MLKRILKNQSMSLRHLCILYLASICAAASADTRINDVDVEGFQKLVERNDGIVLDVRTPEEVADGHIPGAVNIPIRTLADNLDKIPTDQPVMIYCASGHRAALGLGSLQALGYENARSFPGSWKAWTSGWMWSVHP